jgi:hemoglobin
MPTLYDRLGGSPAIDSLIPAFYARILADPDLSPFFKHASMDSLQDMQRQFFAMALGGPIAYIGLPLSSVHHGRGITTALFTRFTSHLLDTLSSLDVSRTDADEVIARLDTFANEITGTSY